MLADQLQQAVSFHRHGQLDRAQAIYEDILRSEPRHFDALHLLGLIAAARGNLRKAVELIDAALRITPGSAVAYNNRGAALEELGEWDAALASYERACGAQRAYRPPGRSLDHRARPHLARSCRAAEGPPDRLGRLGT